MHDINGKALHIGNTIHTYAYGMLLIKDIKEEHNPDKGGALIECIGVGRGGGSIELRTHEQKVTKVRTWKELATEALQVQDASNLVGVVQSFALIIREVSYRLDSEGKGGSTNVWQHPVCVLYSNKISSLTSSDSVTLFGNAMNWAYEQAPHLDPNRKA